MQEKLSDASAEYAQAAHAIVPLNVIMDVVHQEAAWHRKAHLGLSRFDIDKITRTAPKDLEHIRSLRSPYY